MILRLISGGQSGVDRIALEVAREFGIETGGYAPKGWLTEDGPRPDLGEVYGLVEHGSEKYPVRRKANITAAHLTIVIAHDPTSFGTIGALNDARKLGKPCWVYDPSRAAPLLAAGEIAGIADVFGPVVLNVAGNRASGSPAWFLPAARVWLGAVLSLVRFDERFRETVTRTVKYHGGRT